MGEEKRAPISMLGRAMLILSPADSGECQLSIFIHLKSEDKAGRRRERGKKDQYVGKDGKKKLGLR
jgi:hypothetical protein